MTLKDQKPILTEERMKICQEHERKEITVNEMAKKMGVPKGTAINIYKEYFRIARLIKNDGQTPIVYGYARVSTTSQARDGNSLEAQQAALRAAGATEIFTDTCTGTKLERPQFEALNALLQAGDTLVVTKLDRFARTVGQASELITDLISRGITIHVLNLGVLDNSSMSVLLRNVLLSFAQFERDMIVERTQEGRAIARTKAGYREGRPKKYTAPQMQHALELLKDHSYTQVTEMTGISKSTLIRARRQAAHDIGRAERSRQTIL